MHPFSRRSNAQRPQRERVSKYMPHQGARECARRLRQLEKQMKR